MALKATVVVVRLQLEEGLELGGERSLKQTGGKF